MLTLRRWLYNETLVKQDQQHLRVAFQWQTVLSPRHMRWSMRHVPMLGTLTLQMQRHLAMTPPTFQRHQASKEANNAPRRPEDVCEKGRYSVI